MQTVRVFIARAFVPCVATIALGTVSGCAKYRRAPLDPVAVQETLRQVSLSDLTQDADGGLPRNAPDISKGLGPDEVGLAALILNPALKAKRLELGVAAGQLVNAGLYPNPSLDTKSLLASQRPSGRKSVEASLSFEILRWQERSAEKDAKKSNAEAVRYEILGEEWKTVSEARTAYWTAVASDQKLKLNQDEVKLSEQLLEGIRSRIRNGTGTALDLNLGELQNIKLKAETDKLQAESISAGRALRKSIGLPFDADLKLRIAERPLARPARKWKSPELPPLVIRSAALKAAEWRYSVSENDLRAAIARQYPSLKLGPSGTFDFDGHIWSSLLGFVATMDVPLLNHNQGEVKEKWAARDVARAEYISKLHESQAAVADAAEQVESIESRLESQEKELLPKAQASIQLSEKAYKAGDISGYELLTAQSMLIEIRRSYLDVLIEYRQALESLEAALGQRLDDVQTPESKP
jgi:cobalt-zinc-cadmium efflux system outer membrane protein